MFESPSNNVPFKRKENKIALKPTRHTSTIEIRDGDNVCVISRGWCGHFSLLVRTVRPWHARGGFPSPRHGGRRRAGCSLARGLHWTTLQLTTKACFFGCRWLKQKLTSLTSSALLASSNCRSLLHRARAHLYWRALHCQAAKSNRLCLIPYQLAIGSPGGRNFPLRPSFSCKISFE
jgi:hypothetical protein